MLTFETWDIEKLIPYDRNPRVNDHAVDKIAAAIKEYGFRVPIVAKSDGLIVDGHLRFKAARKLGLTEIPVILADDLTEAQIKAFRLSVNKMAEIATWDEEMLKIELQELYDIGYEIDLIGFTDEELEDMDIDLDGDLKVIDESKADDVPEVVENPVIKLGDLIELGNHRLLCGDSTDDTDVDKLLSGKKIDLIFTDPPYNVAFNGRSGNHDVIKNDNLSDSDFKKFIDGTIRQIKRVNADHYYVWCNWKFYGILQGELDYKSCIVWAKNVFGLGNGYRHQHEFCLYYGKIDEEIKNESDLWEVKKDTNYVHPTQKPVALSERGIGNHRRAITILDLFGGSGSTLIGCENLNRKAFVMELDEKYAQVIIQRWCDYTSIRTIKINGIEVDWEEYKDANGMA